MRGSSGNAAALGRRDGQKDFSISTRLLLLVILILTPLLLLAGVLGLLYADAERRVIEAERADVADNAAHIVDREVSATVAMLRTLVASWRESNLSEFHRTASEIAKSLNETIVLMDRSGQQIVSTRVPFGSPLPLRRDLGPLAPAFSSELHVSDVLTGVYVPQPIVLVSVPVRRNGDAPYILSASISATKLSGVLVEAGLKPDWVAAIVDRKGFFIARSRNPENFVGRAARPELIQAATGDQNHGEFSNVTLDGITAENSFRRSQLTGWTVVVGVPSEITNAPFHRALWMIVGGGSVLVALAVGMALLSGYQIARPAKLLHSAARALARGEPMSWGTEHRVSEFNEIGRTFDLAAQTMRERNTAQAELLRTNALLGTVLASTPDLIYAKDGRPIDPRQPSDGCGYRQGLDRNKRPQ